MPARQPHEVAAVGGPHREDAVDGVVLLVEALEDHPRAVGRHVAASEVQVRVVGGIERMQPRAVGLDRRRPQRVARSSAGVVRDPDLAAVGPPPRTARPDPETTHVRAVGQDRVPVEHRHVRSPMTEHDRAGRQARRGDGDPWRPEGADRDQGRRHDDQQDEHPHADTLVPPLPITEPIEALDGVLVRRRVDRAMDPAGGPPPSVVDAHGSTSWVPNTRASVRRPSCRCFFTVPGAMSRISAISATGRSSR